MYSSETISTPDPSLFLVNDSAERYTQTDLYDAGILGTPKNPHCAHDPGLPTREVAANEKAWLGEEGAFLLGFPSTIPVSLNRFVTARAEVLTEAQSLLTDTLPSLKQSLTDVLSDYFYHTQPTKRKVFASMITQRLAATNEIIIDDMITNDAPAPDTAAYFCKDDRRIFIPSNNIFKRIQYSTSARDFVDGYTNILLHELLHATSASTGPGQSYRSGLRSKADDGSEKAGSIVNSGLDEVVLENYRVRQYGSNVSGYANGVMFINNLESFMPGIRDKLLIAALSECNPMATLNEIDAFFGVGSVSLIDQRLGDGSGIMPMDLLLRQLPFERRKELLHS